MMALFTSHDTVKKERTFKIIVADVALIRQQDVEEILLKLRITLEAKKNDNRRYYMLPEIEEDKK